MAVSHLLRCPNTTWDNKIAFPELGIRPLYTVFHGEPDLGHENPVEPAFRIVLNNVETRISKNNSNFNKMKLEIKQVKLRSTLTPKRW